MTPNDNDNARPPARDPVDRDLLISRVVDDAASPADWDQLRALAEYDAAVWRELFEAQRAQAELEQAVHQAIAIADDIHAPVGDLPHAGWKLRFRQAASWSGWAVAASVAIFWMAPQLMPPAEGDAEGMQAGLGSLVTQSGPTDDQLNGFEQRGRIDLSQPSMGTLAGADPYPPEAFQNVSTDPGSAMSGARGDLSARRVGQPLGEMPDRVLLEVRQLPNGQLELTYVRQLIERAVVDENELYQVKPDDAGIQRTVPYRTRRPSSGPI